MGECGDKGGDQLDGEEEFWRDFHVVAKFQVGGEFDALGRGDVTISYEDHTVSKDYFNWGLSMESYRVGWGCNYGFVV